MRRITHSAHIAFSLSLIGFLVGSIDLLVPGLAASAPGNSVSQMEVVRASECYRYGDDETPAQAKKRAVILAQELAVRSHHVFVQSSSKIRNFQMEEDLIQNVSAAMLKAVNIEKEETTGQKVCVTISAQLSSVSMEELIRQRVNAREQVKGMEEAVVPGKPVSGLRVWTNYGEQQRNQKFLEGETITIHVQSDRDGFLKLDYCGADGKVVHMVPNKYRTNTYVKAGQEYQFGGLYEHFEVNSPFGDEAVKAIVSDTQIVESQGDEEETCKQYLVKLYRPVRGLKVRPVETTLTLMTESKQVLEYKRERGKPQAK